MKSWEKQLQDRRLSAFASERSDSELKEGLCIVDAKSLYII